MIKIKVEQLYGWRSLLALVVVIILFITITTLGKAAYRINRPINTTGGQVNQYYLWAEETELDPGRWVQHRGLECV